MGTAGQSITLANSIIGVGILAMPFCFQQCGVLLATVILLFMGLISRLCCYFLLKAALIARRRNFEFLAFHVFGPAGKLAVEVGIIGFLMGTCIAYFVVVGDLGPQIIAKLLNINQSDILRTSIMVIVSLVCVLPLGLLRNVDSLSNVSAATIGFYFCLVIKVIAEAATQLFSSEWHTRVEMWKPSGLLQCVPIFSMALFCQTQLFEIFESLATLSLEKMNVVTKNAIHICTAVYFTLGLFGYIAFSSHTISGNILMSLSPTMANDVIKLGFVMSVAFSFPLIIFPCRASLYSFLYRKAHPAHHDHIINHSIPESTFRCITVAIIAVALFISLLIPNIELVLGLVGSTIGVLVCVVFPAACFINVTYKNTNERILAKGVLILGLVILVLGTFANLQAAESKHDRYDDNITPERIDKIVEDFFEKMEKQELDNKPYNQQQSKILKDEMIKKEVQKDSEIQPPNPLPPASNEKQQGADAQKNGEKKIIPPPAEKLVPEAENLLEKVSESHPKNLKTKLNDIQASNGEPIVNKVLDEPKEKAKPLITQDKTQEKNDMIKQQELIETIKQHREEQKELIEEQKEILDELIKTNKELQKKKKEKKSAEAKKIAVESVQKIANIAIKSLSGGSEKPESQKIGDKNRPLENITNEVVQEIAKKAVEAIEEIAEQKPTKQDKEVVIPGVANVGNAPNNNLNSIPVPNNGQANLNLQPNAPNNVLLPSVSNFAPINPPIKNQNSVNVPAPQIPHAEALGQNQNIPPIPETNNIPVNLNNAPLGNPQPIVSQIVNNVQADSNRPFDQQLPMVNENIPAQVQQQSQQSHLNIQQNQNYQQLNQIVQQQNNQNIQQQNRLNQQQNQLNQQQNQLNQQQNHVNQQVKQHKREIDEQAIQKDQIIEAGQSAQQIQKNTNIEPKKAHSHSPDEPQSYKQGEDSQKNAEIKNIVAQNVPIPIATNNDGQENQMQAINGNHKANEQPIEIKDTQNGLNKIETIKDDNGAKDNPNNREYNAVPRQKREVIDCTETISLEPQDKEICKVLIDNKVETKNKIEKMSEEILPSNVDLAKVGLNSIPIELIHHGRSLKSIEKIEKKR